MGRQRLTVELEDFKTCAYNTHEGNRMQIVGALLAILSITLIMAPVGAMVVIYQDNLMGLLVPPEINDLLTGNPSSFLVNDNVGSFDDGSRATAFIAPKFVSANIDNDANTFTVIVDVSNNVNYTFVLETFSTDIRTTGDNYHLVSVDLRNPPVTLNPGETSRVTIVGTWSDEAEAYLMANYAGASQISVQLVDTTISVNGVTVTLSDPIPVEFPLTLEG